MWRNSKEVNFWCKIGRHDWSYKPSLIEEITFKIRYSFGEMHYSNCRRCRPSDGNWYVPSLSVYVPTRQGFDLLNKDADELWNNSKWCVICGVRGNIEKTDILDYSIYAERGCSE